MKLNRRILAFLLALCLTAALPAAAAADGETFNAHLGVTQNADGSLEISIPAENEAVLADQKPSLSIPCTMTDPVVFFNGKRINASLEGEQLSFTVAAPGTYRIAENGVKLTGASLIFEGMIVIKYYCKVADSLLNDPDAYVAFFDGEGTELTRVPVSEGVEIKNNSAENRAYYYSVVAKAMETDVNIRFFTGAGVPAELYTTQDNFTAAGFPFSPNAYAEQMVTGASSPEMRALAGALDDYGAAAVSYFGGSSPVSDTVTNVKAEDLTHFTAATSGTKPAGIERIQMSVMFEADNAMRINFAYGENVNPDGYTYQIDGVGAELMTRADGGRYITVPNIAANKLGKAHTFTVSDGVNTYTMTVSVLSYAKLLIERSNEKGRNLGKALYLYRNAALDKFPTQDAT